MMDEATDLKRRLGSQDRQRVDQYLSGVRTFEKKVRRGTSAECNQDGGPGFVEDRHMRRALLHELMATMLQADFTRVMTFMFRNGGSLGLHEHLDIVDQHHEISHHGGDAHTLDKLLRIDRWRMEQFASFIRLLADTPDGDGRLLDSCAVCMVNEMSDSDHHSYEDLPTLIVGGANGRLRTGRHLVPPERTPMANMQLALLRAGGLELPSLGDSTGVLEELLA